jgi:hypothetical protein
VSRGLPCWAAALHASPGPDHAPGGPVHAPVASPRRAQAGLNARGRQRDVAGCAGVAAEAVRVLSLRAG